MLEPTDLFDPAHYLDCRRPFEQARTLPRWCYTSQTFHERELSRIFFKTWLLVGREDEIARPGDYMTVDTMGGPVIVLRDGEGEVRAFANTCRHRGARVLAGAGSCGRAMKCAYHGWVYALDGSLIGAPEMERTPGFEKADYGLSPVRHASWEGFIWITFDAEAPTLTSYFGDLTTRFASYRFRDFVVTRRSEYRIASNWKLLIDNALEAYHTTEVHKISLGTQITEDRQTIGNWDAIFLPGHTSVAVLPAETAPFVHVAGLEGDLGHGTYFSVLYPNTLFACVQDCMWWLNLMPEGAGELRVEGRLLLPQGDRRAAGFRDRGRGLLPPLGHRHRRGQRHRHLAACGPALGVAHAGAVFLA